MVTTVLIQSLLYVIVLFGSRFPSFCVFFWLRVRGYWVETTFFFIDLVESDKVSMCTFLRKEQSSVVLNVKKRTMDFDVSSVCYPSDKKFYVPLEMLTF